MSARTKIRLCLAIGATSLLLQQSLHSSHTRLLAGVLGLICFTRYLYIILSEKSGDYLSSPYAAIRNVRDFN